MTDDIEKLVFLAFQEQVLAWLMQQEKSMFTLADYSEGWRVLSGVSAHVPADTQMAQIRMSEHVMDRMILGKLCIHPDSMEYLCNVEVRER